MKGNML